MTSHVHVFDVREGGSFRISLTYDAPTGAGKTTALTDTYHGHFVKLVPNERVVEVMEFETADATMRGEVYGIPSTTVVHSRPMRRQVLLPFQLAQRLGQHLLQNAPNQPLEITVASRLVTERIDYQGSPMERYRPGAPLSFMIGLSASVVAAELRADSAP